MRNINDFYGKGSSYECFVCRANKVFAFNANSQNYRNSYFELLYHIKYNDFKFKGVPKYEKRLKEVKIIIIKAMLKMQKRVKEIDLKIQLETLSIQTEFARDEEALILILDKALEITQSYKEY